MKIQNVQLQMKANSIHKFLVQMAVADADWKFWKELKQILGANGLGLYLPSHNRAEQPRIWPGITVVIA